MAMDRSYKDILSASPLKKRVDYDISGTANMDDEQRERQMRYYERIN